MEARQLKALVRLVLLLVFGWLLAACGFDIEDDHLVINALPTLGQNDAWFVLLDSPAEPVNCVTFSGCNAGSVVTATSYGIIGDVDKAKLAAVDELTDDWQPIGELDSSLDEPVFFRFPDEIDTSTGDAFLRLDFVGVWDIGGGEPIENVLSVAISTHDWSG